MTERKLKNIILVTRSFPGKADGAILLRFDCAINPRNLMKIVGAIFEKIKIKNFFLMWTTLNFEGRSKTKKWAKDICKGTLGIECEREWPVGLGATLGDGQKIKNYRLFLVAGCFSGKADSVILLGFQCTINPENLIKIVWSHFWENQIFLFFLMWTTPNFRGRGKTKKSGSRYLWEDPRYKILTR